MYQQYFSFNYKKLKFDPTKYGEAPLIVGIDPDVDKNGVAIVDGNTGKLIDLLNLCEMNYLEFLSVYHKQINKVVFSAGWLNKKINFHRVKEQTRSVSERQAKDVGLNHQVGITLMRLTYAMYGLPIQQLKPDSAKVKTRAKFEIYTGWKGLSNQETRDAGMLISGMYAKENLKGRDMRLEQEV